MSKKSKHARNQAKYMQRKRDAGLEWLTEWVPEPALHAFKAIAKAARKSHAAPDPAQLAAAEVLAAGGEALPDWARRSDILLSVWLLSQTAAGALEQAHAEREAAKGRKGETTATDPIERVADPGGQSLDAVWEEEWQQKILDAAVERVKSRVDAEQYQIFDFYVLRKMSPGEVAAALGVSTGQVYLVKHRIASMVKKEVKLLETKMG